ncbi:MAG: hypothetical protein ACK4UN_10555, partial [Limisphaerales bacterium]
ETLTTPAPFDSFLAGDESALTDEQKIGLRVFMNIGCADCHRGPLRGGRTVRKFGLKKDYWTATQSEKQDAGLFETTREEAELQEAVRIMADVQLGHQISDEDAKAIVSLKPSLVRSLRTTRRLNPREKANEKKWSG